MSEPTGPAGQVSGGGEGSADERHPAPDVNSGVLRVFGRQLKRFRLRAGLERPEFGSMTGYSVSTIAAYEQGRRVPPPRFIDRADEVLDAGGVLQEMKEEVARAQYPAFFRDAARLEGEAVELWVYATQAVPGLLQTEEYMRAVFGMWRPLLDEETLEQRVAARLARQHVFERRPAPLLSFVIDEAVVRRPLGGRSVMHGQLEHLLLIGALRNVEIQIMPLDREDNAGVDGPFTLLNRVGGDQVAYLEAQGRSTMVSDRREVQGIASRYGIIRAQALTPRESLAFVEKLLGEV
ncbi:helix-turn-helix domain-containing protein [Streptomyces somaliensis]|uniref:helix-turn-helix domain-containing protein n=1 Tax=Streptomyces somaliensis TaxID=78355 RepID=UPI0020CCDE55|nr:helix-turn-helix transcriptional regulator [Streptomyces somaliensis]MCP9943934.1 helix-turn-helix domain-containing protein [Streptomyces somaliensis]MCP9962823.1 helix-turn-helix domain-containing protein [Streptomyces somaliensis]MCP9975661.1 helix-turn-helix domain-containing protein [Streptomyces somaliensis]